MASKKTADGGEKNRGGGGTITWEAEEYVQTEKNGMWYLGLGVVCLLLSVGAVILKWWTSLALVILSGVALTMYSVRAPRKLSYSLSGKGLTEGEKTYNLDEYKSFGVVIADGHYSVVLTPRKRFAPRLTVYFPKENGEEIVDFFGARMPMEEVKYDFVDKIVKFLRF